MKLVICSTRKQHAFADQRMKGTCLSRVIRAIAGYGIQVPRGEVPWQSYPLASIWQKVFLPFTAWTKRASPRWGGWRRERRAGNHRRSRQLTGSSSASKPRPAQAQSTRPSGRNSGE